jgi:hypothetical protein
VLGDDPELLVLALAAGAAWLVAAGFLYLAWQPDQPPTGPHTLDLGPEPPAVANLLVHRFRVTGDAVPATVLDLAARGVLEIEQRGPGNYFVRIRGVADQNLTAYELRVLRHLEAHAHDGVVPARALTTGTELQSKRWMRAFASAVVTDTQRRGLTRERLGSPVFTAFGIAALGPAALAWRLAEEVEVGLAVLVGAVALLGWIKARHPQQPTPEGIAAASRWLGVRGALAENEVFATRSPLEVPLWDRLMAYGAALGVAGGASGPLPMGVESDHEAWSSYGGQWRRVRIAYPRLVPLGWGLHPVQAFSSGVALAAIAAGGLSLFAPGVETPTGLALVVAAVAAGASCAAIGVGVALIAMAVTDMGRGVVVTGPILRLRVLGSEKRRRHYVAVDDGSSPTIRAFVLDAVRYSRLAQGDVVTVEVTRALRSVRSILPAADAFDDTLGGLLDPLGASVADE